MRAIVLLVGKRRVIRWISLGSVAAFLSVWLTVGKLSTFKVHSPSVVVLWLSAACAAVVAWAAISVIGRVRKGLDKGRSVLVLVLAVSLAMMAAVFVRVATSEVDGTNFGLATVITGLIGMTFVGLLSLLFVVGCQ